jgi:hypothetical protein
LFTGIVGRIGRIVRFRGDVGATAARFQCDGLPMDIIAPDFFGTSVVSTLRELPEREA